MPSTPSRGPGGEPPWHRPGNERPSWWPDNEPWPPTRPPWQVNRHAILIRLLAATLLLIVLVWVAGALSNHLIRWGGERPWWEQGDQPPPYFALFWLVVVVVAIGLIVRRIQSSVRGVIRVMEATSRVARGDYSVRVTLGGPRDVRKMIEAFNAMTARLEANERERRRLFADIAHELRTPLAVLRGTIEGMMDGVYPRDDAHLAPLLDQTTVITRLLEDLQTVATADSGALRLHREPTDLSDLVDDVVGAFTPAATREGVTIAAEAPATPLPPMEIDPVRIRQVFDNLVSNALRYTPEGGSVRIVTGRADGRVEVSVIDTGRGMPQAEADRMFERFVKSADSGGSGLGLAIAKALVEAHGGTIAATSAPGQGTTVTFTLPLD